MYQVRRPPTFWIKKVTTPTLLRILSQLRSETVSPKSVVSNEFFSQLFRNVSNLTSHHTALPILLRAENSEAFHLNPRCFSKFSVLAYFEAFVFLQSGRILAICGWTAERRQSSSPSDLGIACSRYWQV
jgi:hypothetical protein